MSEYTVLIENKAKKKRYKAIVQGEIEVSWSRQFEAGILL